MVKVSTASHFEVGEVDCSSWWSSDLGWFYEHGDKYETFEEANEATSRILDEEKEHGYTYTKPIAVFQITHERVTDDVDGITYVVTEFTRTSMVPHSVKHPLNIGGDKA